MSCRFQGVLGRDITVVVSPMCEVCGAGAGAKAQGERGGADCSQSEGWGGQKEPVPWLLLPHGGGDRPRGGHSASTDGGGLSCRMAPKGATTVFCHQ